MKQLILVLVSIVSFHAICLAQDSKVKVDGSDHKKKVEMHGTHQTGIYSPSSHYYVAHRYARHRPMNRVAYRRHPYHSYSIHHRKHIHRRSVAHYKKVKGDNKKGEYKAKA